MQDIKDYGKQPFVLNLEQETVSNDKFRVAKWTGANLQMTLMSIPVGDDIGLEVHENHDQFLRIEQGQARVDMGPSQDNLDFQESAEADFGIFVPAGTWHNVTNVGDVPLKAYSIYAPAEHPAGTVHGTKADAEAAEY